MAASVIKSVIMFYYLCIAVEYCVAEVPPPAYILAANNANVPPEILYAVALTESGTKTANGELRPWPWTLNIKGTGYFFNSQIEACSTLRQALTTTSSKRIDVGIAQINIGYHGHYVTSPCELLEPYTNLRIAAMLLRQHYQQSNNNQNWLIVAGKYHAPNNPTNAARYRSKVKKHLIKQSL